MLYSQDDKFCEGHRSTTNGGLWLCTYTLMLLYGAHSWKSEILKLTPSLTWYKQMAASILKVGIGTTVKSMILSDKMKDTGWH